MSMLLRTILCCAAVSAAIAGAVADVSAHETMPTGRAEQSLRGFETETLGSRHAREHALQRQLAREAPSSPDRAALPSSAASETVFGERFGAGGGLAATAVDCDSASTAPECAGSWAAPFSIPVMGINAVMLPTGKVMWWAYPTNPNAEFGDPDAENTAEAWLWDPATGKLKHVDPPLWLDPADGQVKPANIWCSGQSFLQDGRVVVAGGNLAYSEGSDDYKGLDAVFTFNPWNERWTRQPDMEHGRWYPSQLLLPDGRTLILSGFDETGGGYSSTNKQVEVLTPSASLDGQGSISSIGERGDDFTPPDGGLYPHTFVMPSGRAMIAGPDPNDSWYLNDPGGGDLTDWDNFAWDELGAPTPGVSRQRLYGTGVLMPPAPGDLEPSDRVALIGGDDRIEADNGPAVASVRIHDEDDPAGLGGTLGAPLQLGRGHHNTVLLADGSMVTVGGGVGFGDTFDLWESTPQRKRVELYDPVADEWRLGAAQAEYRAYHSTAVLLPDGRVISAGDDYNGGIDRDTAEVYSPPYLFRGARPAITGAPKTVAYGTAFDVDYSGPEVTRAALVAPGATTHAVDMNQRWVPLDVDAGSPGSATIHAPPGNAADPPGKNVAPPGWYMLFLLSADGVPSVASWVRVDATPPQPGAIVVRKAVTGGAGSFDFSGAPFSDFSLADGQERSKTVVASEYSIVEAVEAGFALTGVTCDDANSAGSVAQRRATVRVEAGETVRCTFTSAAVAGPPPPPPPPPPAPGDRTAPAIKFDLRRGLDPRRRLLRGEARDEAGVRRVDVALGTRRGKRCRWWSKPRKRLARPSSCKRPLFVRARLSRSAGRLRWTATLGARPPAGRYRVVIRAADKRGNVRRVTRAPVVVRSR